MAGELAPGGSTEISSFLGHVFSAHSLDPTQYSDSVSPLDVAKMPMRKGENGEQEPMSQEAFQNIVDFMVRLIERFQICVYMFSTRRTKYGEV